MSGTRTLNLRSRVVETAPTSQKPRQAPQDTQSEPGSERATSPASVAMFSLQDPLPVKLSASGRRPRVPQYVVTNRDLG